MNRPDEYPRCETCRHWEKNVCGTHDCKKLLDVVMCSTDDPYVSVQDIETPPHFGCIHHEAKEQADESNG